MTTTMVKLHCDDDTNEHWVRVSLIAEVVLIATPMADDTAAEVRVTLDGPHHTTPAVAQFADMNEAERYRAFLLRSIVGGWDAPDDEFGVDALARQYVVATSEV